MSTVLRVYQSTDLGPDGYPLAWHRCQTCHGKGVLDDPVLIADPDVPAGEAWMGCDDCEGAGAIKHLVREQAGHRCVRCHHPYVVKSGDGDWSDGPGGRRIHWSACDYQCEHDGPLRRVKGDVVEPVFARTAREAVEVIRSIAAGEVQAAWRILTVHHLNGRKHDCRWWNLAALCQRCHLAIQGKVVLERVYPLEHTEWFKPYAAGWYAHAYLDVDLNREETIERLDALLALERMDQHTSQGTSEATPVPAAGVFERVRTPDSEESCT